MPNYVQMLKSETKEFILKVIPFENCLYADIWYLFIFVGAEKMVEMNRER